MTPNPETSHPGIVKAIWLHLLIEGGRWKHAEIADLMGCSRRRMDSVLFGMVKNGYVSRFPDGARKNGVAFGVTPACRIPGDITLGELKASPVQTARTCQEISKGWSGRRASSTGAAANDSRRSAA